MDIVNFPDLQQAFSLKPFCTFNVGGLADYYYEAKDLSLLPELLRLAHAENIPVFIFGGGSNVLFLDEGFRGLVIRVTASNVQINGTQLIADAGTKWTALIRAMHEGNLTGLESFNGLPGTLGGAVAGNAGCFGTEIKDVFSSAKILDQTTGNIREVGMDYFQFSYRWSMIKVSEDVVLSVTLQLKNLEGERPEQGSLQARLAKQPPGKSSGSFFKNPSPDKPAGWLIDQCGLKGFQIGGAQISEKHANFFLNHGKATSSDILALRDEAKKQVQIQFDIELEEEVVIPQIPILK
jgi:UDP-N-acetylmuramate dehydrogenase